MVANWGFTSDLTNPNETARNRLPSLIEVQKDLFYHFVYHAVFDRSKITAFYLVAALAAASKETVDQVEDETAFDHEQDVPPERAPSSKYAGWSGPAVSG